jgi:hypothetical protein
MNNLQIGLVMSVDKTNSVTVSGGVDMFFKMLKTEIVLERRETENGIKKVERMKMWLRDVLARPEVLGVAGWIERDCEDPTYERPVFVIFVKKGEAKFTNDPLEMLLFYAGRGVKHRCPGVVMGVEEVDEVPEFSKEDIEKICWCADESTFTVWRKTQKKMMK